MSTPHSTHNPHTPDSPDKAAGSKKHSRLAALGLVLSSLILWLAGRMSWVTAVSEDDKAGRAVNDVPGATWSVELIALASAFLAGALAVLVLRRQARRIIGVVCAIAAIAGSVGPTLLLVQGADPERAKALLTAGATSSKANAPVSISEWAVVTEATVNPLGVALALLGFAVALVAAVVVVMRPGHDSPRVSKYERAATRREKLEEELETSPDSQRVMWDALDAGLDPTDAGKKGRR